MLEHGVGEQTALLGISLYVLACKSATLGNTYQTAHIICRRRGSHALGTIERGEPHWQKPDLRIHFRRLCRLQHTRCNNAVVEWFPRHTLSARVFWQSLPCYWGCFDARSLPRSDGPLFFDSLGRSRVLWSCSRALVGGLSGSCERVEVWHVGDCLACCADHCTDVDITGNSRANHHSTTSLRNRAEIDTLQQ
jgi:hypothetical protein